MNGGVARFVDTLAAEILAAGLPLESVYLTTDPDSEDDEVAINRDVDVQSNPTEGKFRVYRQTEIDRRFLFCADNAEAIVIFLKHYLGAHGRGTL